MLKINSKLKSKIINATLRFINLRVKEVFLGKGSTFSRSTTIGSLTRINGHMTCKGGAPVTIGKYCAIGYEVRIISSNHSMNFLNIQYEFQKKLSNKVLEAPKKGVEIGNGVWIGDNVIILPGVKIGNGAVLAAGAVVTKSVDDYQVVGGNPSKVLKSRFSEEVLAQIKGLDWWNWSYDKIVKNKKLFELDLSLANEEMISKLLKETHE